MRVWLEDNVAELQTGFAKDGRKKKTCISHIFWWSLTRFLSTLIWKRKRNICISCKVLFYYIAHGCTRTSYFCLVNWYCRSNFSASSWYIHSHNSLAFSLWKIKKPCVVISDWGFRYFTVILHLHPLESFLARVYNVKRFASFAQDLLFFLSLRLPLSTPFLVLLTWNETWLASHFIGIISE